MAAKPSYSSGVFMLEIDGKAMGFLADVEGGEAFAEVIREAADSSGVVRKHPGKVRFEPIHLSFGTGMKESFYQWVADVLRRGASAKNGAIVFCDYNLKEQARREFTNALITEIGFPALDGSSKEAAYVSVTLQPETTRMSSSGMGRSVAGLGPKTRKKALASNFALKIDGLETACTRVSRVDAMVVKQEMTEVEPGVPTEALTVPNLVFALSENHAKDFYDWFEDFANQGEGARSDERNGTLEYLDPSMKTALFTINFSNLGIVRIRKERSVAGAEVIARVSVELYCEEMALTVAEESKDSSPSPSAPSPSIAPAFNSAGTPLVETLLGIMSGRIGGEEALLATLRAAGSPQVMSANDSDRSELIARRLLATVQPTAPGTSVPRRDEGVAVGARWAAEKATLEELNQVSALESGEWTAMRLDSDHSLIVQLSEAGVLPLGSAGPINLERDVFVEGIVAGASRVLRNASAHLSRLASPK